MKNILIKLYNARMKRFTNYTREFNFLNRG